MCRNPLESGQPFLLYNEAFKLDFTDFVAIPSNRVNRSYLAVTFPKAFPKESRNPLESGQPFLQNDTITELL